MQKTEEELTHGAQAALDLAQNMLLCMGDFFTKLGDHPDHEAITVTAISIIIARAEPVAPNLRFLVHKMTAAQGRMRDAT
jgi:hypothetical protein